MGSALIALNEMGKLAAANWVLVIGLFVVAAAGFAVFWPVENHSDHPLVATELLKRRSNPSELLGSEAMRETIRKLESEFDIICRPFVRCPPSCWP